MQLVNKFLFFLLFLLIGCKINAKENQSENYGIYVNQIINSFAKEIEKEFDLICIGGGGSMPRDIQSLSVNFIAYRRATMEQARELEVRIIERFVTAVNEHEQIRPYLREYPFSVSRANLSIAFRKRDNSCYADGSVVHVFQAKNHFFYYSEDPNTHKRLKITDELYEEALKIVQKKAPFKTNNPSL